MPKSRNDKLQGTLTLLVLRTLESRGALHGYGLCEHIRQVSGELLEMEEGSLYPALHRLEKQKLVAGSWQTTENGRQAKLYTITAAGRNRLSEVRKHWKSVARGVKLVLRFQKV